MRYLYGTKHHTLTFNPNTDTKLIAYIDASFGIHYDYKSHTGVVIQYAGNTVYVRSSKQRIITKDSTEAELVALSDKMQTFLWCIKFIKSQSMKVNSIPIIYQDNMPVIHLVSNPLSKFRTKFLAVRAKIVKEHIDQNDYIIEHLSTTQMVADVLTKPSQGNYHRYMANRLLSLC